MKDVENRAKEYDCLMQTIWEDLELATNNPEQKQRRIDPDDMKNYREALEFLSEHDPGGDWKEYDFSFLESPPRIYLKRNYGAGKYTLCQ